MDFEKEFSVSHTYDLLVLLKTIGSYTLKVVAGEDTIDPFSTPNQNHLKTSDYTHFFFLLCRRGIDTDNLMSDEIQKLCGVDLSQYIRVGDGYFGMVPKKTIEDIIHGLSGQTITAVKTTDPIKDYSKVPCVKCGMCDTYNGPSDKYNGEIRCYLHC